MKTFLLSITFVISLIILSIANAIAVFSITDQLTKSLDSAERGETSLSETLELYERHSFFLGLTVQNQNVERIRENLLILLEYDGNAYDEYARGIFSLLRHLIADIFEESTISFSNIL